jgi:hypothetical protein
MATDISTGFSNNFDVPMVDLPGRLVIRTRYFDASSIAITAAEQKIMKLPAGCIVKNTITNCITAEGDAAALDIGLDSGDGTEFETDGDLNAVDITESADDIEYLTSEDWLTITPSIALDTAVFMITVEYFMADTGMTAVAL